jgi:outer membrane immunogenic protein
VKHTVLAAAFVMSAAVTTGPALAADMALKAAPAPTAYDWSGTYIGGFIGGGWATNDFSDPGLGFLGTLLNVPITQTANNSGFIGGVEVGSNYQIGKLVIGVEADWAGGDINGTNTTSFSPLGVPGAVINRAIGANTN